MIFESFSVFFNDQNLVQDAPDNFTELKQEIKDKIQSMKIKVELMKSKIKDQIQTLIQNFNL